LNTNVVTEKQASSESADGDQVSIGRSLYAFLTYAGAPRDRHLLRNSPIPAVINILMATVLTILIWRNGLLNPHPIGWFLGAVALGYGALLIMRPTHLNWWRIAVLGWTALAIAILMPLRTGDHVLATAHGAMLALMAIFYLHGSAVALTIAILFSGYVGYELVFIDGRPVSYAFSSTATIFGCSITALLLQHHFIVRGKSPTDDS
jgi:hypothetical protein